MQTCFLHEFSLMSIFFIVEERLWQQQSSRRLSKEEIKKELNDSLVYNENIDREDLNEQANIMESYEEAMDIIKEYKDIIKTNKKNIIQVVGKYPKMMKASVTLNFLKIYYKDIKNVCKENEEDFKEARVI